MDGCLNHVVAVRASLAVDSDATSPLRRIALTDDGTDGVGVAEPFFRHDGPRILNFVESRTRRGRRGVWSLAVDAPEFLPVLDLAVPGWMLFAAPRTS